MISRISSPASMTDHVSQIARAKTGNHRFSFERKNIVDVHTEKIIDASLFSLVSENESRTPFKNQSLLPRNCDSTPHSPETPQLLWITLCMSEILSLKWLILTVMRADCLINRHCASISRPPIFSGLTDDSFSFPQPVGGHQRGNPGPIGIIRSRAEESESRSTYAQRLDFAVEKQREFLRYSRYSRQISAAINERSLPLLCSLFSACRPPALFLPIDVQSDLFFTTRNRYVALC